MKTLSEKVKENTDKVKGHVTQAKLYLSEFRKIMRKGKPVAFRPRIKAGFANIIQ